MITSFNVSRGDMTAGFGYGIDTLNNGARQIRNLTDDFIGFALGMKIDERVDFNDMNYMFMKKFMAININEHDTTLNSLGNDAHLFGNPNAITGMAQRPTYAQSVNYVTNFASSVESDERQGVITTRLMDTTSNSKDKPYVETKNLYPDELNSGYDKFSDGDKWKLNNNRNSILYKTKKLFNDRKINTLIARFGTATDDGRNGTESAGDAATRKYGMSHGRNLLKKSAEEGGGKYDVNGYNNPYCRVWTHHYQYDRLDKLIRPFIDNGGYMDLENLHKWNDFETESKSHFKDGNYVFVPKGWKSGETGWNKSVLNKNGFVNITPKYKAGGKDNIHTRDCMFSIENLAWRGYDPYSFEKALSWEQRGPLGGRIMWFPPYGLSFNETTQTNWSSNTFIGRGEDVYTYVNTVRSGTLSFIMLTDHPSIVDYANWNNENDNKFKDTDLLRFFAGCDDGTVLNAVEPTSLTNEGIDNSDDKEEILNLEVNPPIPEEKEIKDGEESIQFYVFFPNDYSGCYDAPNGESTVNSMGYLLFGKGANKNFIEGNLGDFDDLIIDFNLANFDTSLGGPIGNGYEMFKGNGNSGGISVSVDENNFIVGSKFKWFPLNVNEKSWITEYIPEISRKWMYRIDGEYKVPSQDQGGYRIKNMYDEILAEESNYKDTGSFGLNLSSEVVVNSGFVFGETDNVYSLAEVSAAIAQERYPETYSYLTGNRQVDTEKVEKIHKLLNEREITNIEVTGYSSSHGWAERNLQLATNRARTVKQWLINCKVASSDKFKGSKVESGVSVETIDTKNIKPVNSNMPQEGDTSKLKAKFFRSAKVVINFAKTKTERLVDINGDGQDGFTVYQKYNGFTPFGFDKDGYQLYRTVEAPYEVWYETRDGELRKRKDAIVEETTDKRLILKYQDTSAISGGQKNRYRYGQEYHFFKELKKDDPIKFEKLTEKLQYFDPAFHSMTPEGFTERLTFLNQCTRQGNTVTTSNGANSKTASNLAFGRPPFCVLRIGDFYYQTIVIDSINIDYSVSGGLQWDLNPEGAGVQPMLAQINISFKFIGGGDLGGPIRRLQNAMTFNYYANSRLHDNRADRVAYAGNFEREMGALNYHDIEEENTYAYTTEMAK